MSAHGCQPTLTAVLLRLLGARPVGLVGVVSSADAPARCVFRCLGVWVGSAVRALVATWRLTVVSAARTLIVARRHTCPCYESSRRARRRVGELFDQDP